MAANEVYLVPKDHSKHSSVCISDELLMAIMQSKQQAVFDFDFSKEEKEV